MEKPKTLLVLISKHIMRRNILETEFWPQLLAQLPDTKIVLVGEPDGEEYYTEKFSHPNVTFEFANRQPGGWWFRLVTFLVRTGTNSHGVTLYRERSLEAGQTGLVFSLFKRYLSGTLGRFSWYKKCIRLLYRTVSKKWITHIYKTYQPDMAFLPSLIDIDIDGVFGVTAKRHGVPVVGMVRSWDNLSIHGLLPYVPDQFILQNTWLRESAETFQALDMQKVDHTVIGLPHYDAYYRPESLIKDKVELFTALGLDPTKRTIYFTGFDIYLSEAMVPKLLDAAIRDGRLPADVQVLFTRHPASRVPLEEYALDTLSSVTYVDLFENTKVKFQGSDEMFVNFVTHADVVVNVASTVGIDCAVLDKPVICISFDDPVLSLGYWSLAERLFDSFDHYERFINIGGAYKASSPEALIKKINEYLDDPSLDREKRREVLELFVAPFDGQAGRRLVAQVVEKFKSV